MNSLYSFSAAIVYTQCDPIRKPLSFYKAKTKTKTKPQNLSCSFRHPYNKLRVSALKSDPSESHQTGVADDEGAEKLPLRQNDANFDSGWLPAFPHVLVASMSNFIFGYHIGSVFAFISLTFLFDYRFTATSPFLLCWEDFFIFYLFFISNVCLYVN